MFFGDVFVWADWTSLSFYHRSGQELLGKRLWKSAGDGAFHRRVCALIRNKEKEKKESFVVCVSLFPIRARLGSRQPQYLLDAEKRVSRLWRWKPTGRWNCCFSLTALVSLQVTNSDVITSPTAQEAKASCQRWLWLAEKKKRKRKDCHWEVGLFS